MADPMSEKTILAMNGVERIVYMDKEGGWAVVTLHKEGRNRLGIRWNLQGFCVSDHGLMSG